ncbi:MAG: type-F conjugative transfer system pilin assembly protein TraF [Gammaproteobacteria bacterium]|nr:type-F conjugative transfer system pilin assembly protein TraF [Gammaproteobacteria bacterium]MDH5651262.1 type-F conjugative transfer system pilin assembly protein TraF [Gammaproteobacteria bacterium]
MALPTGVNAVSHEQWFGRHAEGWFWYVTPPVDEEQRTDDKAGSLPSTVTMLPPKAALKAFQEKLENAQALAIMKPTDENVAAYLHLQKQAMENSQQFANVWQQVVWTTPELDHTLVRPTSPQAVNAYYDKQNAQHKVELSSIARTHGLFYFFKGSCPYCKRFSPMLKIFAEQHGFHITAISLDGGNSPDFPNPRLDNGTAKRLGVNTVPAVYLIQPRERSVQPVSFGLISPSELEQRILTLINHPTGSSL